MHVTTIRLDDATRQRLHDLAREAAGGNRSEVIRRLLSQATIRHVIRADVALDDGSGEVDRDRK